MSASGCAQPPRREGPPRGPIRISSYWTRLLRPTLMPLDLMKGAKLEPQVAETEFTCKLITIRSKKSFAEVTDALENLFKMVDLQRLADMTVAGDQAGIHAYFEDLSGDHKFSIFFKLDQGSTQRLAGIPLVLQFFF